MPFTPLPLETVKENEFQPLAISISGVEPVVDEEVGFKTLPLQTTKQTAPFTPEEPSFAAKHPALYGIGRGAVVETVKDLVPYLKYVDPKERERFMKLSQQKQTRELLLQNLETVALVGAKPLTEGVKAVAKHKVAPFLAKHLPKTYAKLQKVGQVATKPLGKGRLKAAPEVEVAATETVAPEIEELTKFIKETAVPKRTEQEAIYTKIRGERIKEVEAVGKEVYGEAGYYAKLSKLKGKMTQVEFHSIRGKFTPEKTDRLFAFIEDSTKLDTFEKVTAGRGLAKIFGEFGGTVPVESELTLIDKVFGQEFTKAILSKRPLFVKAKEVGLEVANIPRSLMASFDLSAPLRQGVFLIGRPRRFASAFKDMFKYFASEKSYTALSEEIAARPTYKLMKESRLALTEMGGKLAAREEAFMSNYAEMIPGIGRIVRMSGRAHTGFLKKLRADVFDDVIKKGADLGITDSKFLKDAANYINHATGRGTLGEFEKSAVAINTAFFSPRLVMSRLNLLNPVFYTKLHPQVRKEALTDLFKFGAAASTVLGLAAAGGADVGLDPRSADFLKIKIGNKRWDILGSFQQPIRMAAQVISGEVVSSTTGKVITLGEGYRGLTRTEIISRFVESKEAPLFSLATALLRGKNSMGELVDVPTEVANRFIPMALQDMKDFYEEEGVKGVPMAIPALFGVGAMSYGGVQSYGLSGKDHPKLNDELNRLKTSMGYPSTVAFGQELDIKEYKLLKEKTGKEIAKVLTETMSMPYYKKMNDRFKVQRIEQLVDQTKDRVKMEVFPNKQYESKIKSSFKATEGFSEEEAKQAARDFVEKRQKQ